MTVCRSKEKEIIHSVLWKKKSLFLHGPSGTGKTFLINRVLEGLSGRNFLYSPDSSTIKRALLGFLSDDFKAGELCRLNVLHLKEFFYKKLKANVPYLIFDHFTRVGPKYFAFLENLLERAPIIIIARSPFAKDIGDGVHLIWSFEHLEISNFNRKETRAFLERFKDDFQMKPASWDLFQNDIFHLSQGNPRTIEEICRYAKNRQYRKGDTINFNLINLDRKIYLGKNSM